MSKVFPGDIRLARQHLARALELDPSLRAGPKPMALDAALEETIIERALRMAADAAPALRSTRRGKLMPKFNTNALFQGLFRPDRGVAFARAWEARHGAGRKRFAHAMDEAGAEAMAANALREALEHLSAVEDDRAEPDFEQLRELLKDANARAPREAAPHLRHALNHVSSVEASSSELDTERLRRYLEAALETLRDEAEDDAPEDEREYLRAEGYTDGEIDGRETGGDEPEFRFGGSERGPGPLLTGGGRDRGRRRGRDAEIGETEARSVVTTQGLPRDPDHRDDFASARDRRVARDANGSRGGSSWRAHDSAMFDADALFQR